MRVVQWCVALVAVVALSACVSEADLPGDLVSELETRGSVTFADNEITLDEQGVVRTRTNQNIVAAMLLVLMVVPFGVVLALFLGPRESARLSRARRMDAIMRGRSAPSPPKRDARWRELGLLLFMSLSLLSSLCLFGDLKVTADPATSRIIYERHFLMGLFVHTQELPARPKSSFRCGEAPYGSIGYSVYVDGGDHPLMVPMALNLLAFMDESMLERCHKTAEALNRLTLPPEGSPQ